MRWGLFELGEHACPTWREHWAAVARYAPAGRARQGQAQQRRQQQIVQQQQLHINSHLETSREPSTIANTSRDLGPGVRCGRKHVFGGLQIGSIMPAFSGLTVTGHRTQRRVERHRIEGIFHSSDPTDVLGAGMRWGRRTGLSGGRKIRPTLAVFSGYDLRATQPTQN